MSTLVPLFIISCILAFNAFPETDSPGPGDFSRWIERMKNTTKGPFTRILWYCNDGTVLPPDPYACETHGGGIQRGEWGREALQLRQAGYFVANVLADLDVERLSSSSEGREQFKQLLLERFLIQSDDGWIFRKARAYRGVVHAEREIEGAQELLLALLGHYQEGEYLVLREAVRLLPQPYDLPSITAVRQLTTKLAEKDPGFAPLRDKLHGMPDGGDTDRVINYAERRGLVEDSEDYLNLAMAIERLFQPPPVTQLLSSLIRRLPKGRLSEVLRLGMETLSTTANPDARFRASSQMAAGIRAGMADMTDPATRLKALRTVLVLELISFSTGNTLVEKAEGASLRQRLGWLETAAEALFGAGLISHRQLQALRDSFRRLQQSPITLAEYHRELQYLSRVPDWSRRWLNFHFDQSIRRLGVIEPLVQRYLPDRLRGGPLLIYSNLLDSLLQSANRAMGIEHRLFGEAVGQGLRSLNPGLARGILRHGPKQRGGEKLDSGGIYLLPATTEELSPVAGILTLDAGNVLSHIQILAANLGIPNVVVDGRLLPRLTSMFNQPVVLASSPGGRVVLEQDAARWNSVFGRESDEPEGQIQVDLQKLDLEFRQPVALRHLRTQDSGRIVGPKAANLGELKHHFPDAVADGVVIPFGVFRQLLERPLRPGGPTVFNWMQSQYELIRNQGQQGAERDAAVKAFLERLRQWILDAGLDPGFRQALRDIMAKVFGPDGSYRLFVRSDTNVEDLPGFTGAGLNLTLPNVGGFENILDAISRVWASPFTERAFAWRQGRMDHPEHVYPSVLLMRSVGVDKSGVLVSQDVETGSRAWNTIAVNEGVGGAVHGQAAEELLLHTASAETRLLAEAGSPLKRVLTAEGGLRKVPVSGVRAVLEPAELKQLVELVRTLPQRFPIVAESGLPVPVDVEFGFQQGRLVLFQIRPYLRSRKARQNNFLVMLDRGLAEAGRKTINLETIPGG